MSEKTFLQIIEPDDWHLHLRDGDVLKAVLPYTVRQFNRAIIMPNLDPPITSVRDALAYRNRINKAVPENFNFAALMTLYLTDETSLEEIKNGKIKNILFGAKLYPAGATTNSSRGVTDVKKIYRVFECMEKIGLPLLVHGEVTDKSVDIFDREAVFIERVLDPLVRNFPDLKVVFEHISSAEGVQFVENSSTNVGATVTPHHLLINRNAIFNGGIRPHMYCLPIAKTKHDQLELRRAVTSGSEKFFLGTDSAPHLIGEKESSCGCAGIFSAPCALELYAQVFEEENALEKFESFASINGPRFYGLPLNSKYIKLERVKSRVREKVVTSEGLEIQPFFAGEELSWTLLSTVIGA